MKQLLDQIPIMHIIRIDTFRIRITQSFNPEPVAVNFKWSGVKIVFRIDYGLDPDYDYYPDRYIQDPDYTKIVWWIFVGLPC
jgi:hypothetical protein